MNKYKALRKGPSKPIKKTPAPKHRPPLSSSSVIGPLYLKQEFDRLHKEHAVILKRIDDLGKQGEEILTGIEEIKDSLDNVPIMVTPELEAAIKSVATTALKIDQKVPDKNVPPAQ